MARFDLGNYIDVAERIDQFYSLYPTGFILTELLNVEGWNGKQTQFIVKSTAGFRDTENGASVILSTGLAEESFAASAKDGANFTSPLENAETSSIGRCLANLNFATTRTGARQRPSRQEMEKVQRHEADSAKAPANPALDNLNRLLREFSSESGERKALVIRALGRDNIASLAELTPEDIDAVVSLLGFEGIQ